MRACMRRGTPTGRTFAAGEMGLTLAGALFGPIHNVVALAIGDWQPAELVASKTALPLETVWFVLHDLREAKLLASRARNGTEYRMDVPPHPLFDSRGRATAALRTLRARVAQEAR